MVKEDFNPLETRITGIGDFRDVTSRRRNLGRIDDGGHRTDATERENESEFACAGPSVLCCQTHWFELWSDSTGLGTARMGLEPAQKVRSHPLLGSAVRDLEAAPKGKTSVPDYISGQLSGIHGRVRCGGEVKLACPMPK